MVKLHPGYAVVELHPTPGLCNCRAASLFRVNTRYLLSQFVMVRGASAKFTTVNAFEYLFPFEQCMLKICVLLYVL